jgi:hypothetical protein
MRIQWLVLALLAWLIGISPVRAEEPLRRLLYVVTPGIRNYLEFGGAGILVFDIDDGHRFVRRIETPASREALRESLADFAARGIDYLVVDGVNIVKKHVKPIEVKKPAATSAAAKAPVTLASDDKFVSLAKYSYYESGKKWVKVLLDFKDIKNHPADKVTVEFKPRSFTVRVMEFKGQNYQFQVPKTQCAIVPEECSHTIKSDTIQISLRKAKDDDNWWSLFRTKAVGEVLSD